MLDLSPEVVVPVAVIALLAVSLAAFRWAVQWSAHQKSTITPDQAAAEIGLRPDPHADLSAALDGFELFQNSLRNDRLFNFCYVGEAQDVRMRIIEFQLESAQSQMLGIKIPIITTVVAFEAEDLGLPIFVAKPRGLSGVTVPDLLQQGLAHLDHEFSKIYAVTTQDKREVDLGKLFNSEVRVRFREHRLVVESTRNRLILYRRGKTVPNQMLKEHIALSFNLLITMRRAWEKRDHPDDRAIVVDADGRLRLAAGTGHA